jgi:hypothetical protein
MKTTTEPRRLPVQLHLLPNTIRAIDKLAETEEISRAAFLRRLVTSFTRSLRDEAGG